MSSYEEALKRLKAEGQYRSMRCVDSTQGAKIVLDGKPVLNFSGNNSLGLAAHPALIEAAHQGLEQYGLGSGASRLISGNMKPHQDLERALAEFMKTEQVRLFASGYQANTGVLPALVEKDDLILSDALNHASLIDGIRLCRAPCEIHPHNDLKALEKALRKAPSSRKIWVVTESLFSMEGDRAPLKEIVALKKERPFMLYVDEAHAVGSLGPQGRGLAAEAGCSEEADLLLGTLGKAFGVCGAFVAARREIAELLVNKARTLIYTTASPPALACAALKALAEVKAADDRRRKLRENIDYFRGQIAN
ncbi:MAG: 8-amino-7-oxononanoate synthase, partial [Planctomycetes bacterium]|nr:8-amino-7-oxononanoate synthase [Planctomycetota bacterium]